MKICFFSDIHGNLAAFKVAQKAIIAEDCHFNIFLGDICGYYFEPVECWKLLLDIPNLQCVLGNHDQLFLNFLKQESVSEIYSQKYGQSLHLLFQQRKNQEVIAFIEWLELLPNHFFLMDEKILCCHASPNDYLNGYLYPDSNLTEINLPASVQACFMGHTHYTMLRFCNGIVFANPGSIGQPRNGQNSSYGIYDTDTQEFELKYVQYDIKAFIDLLKERNTIPCLYTILERSL